MDKCVTLDGASVICFSIEVVKIQPTGKFLMRGSHHSHDRNSFTFASWLLLDPSGV